MELTQFLQTFEGKFVMFAGLLAVAIAVDVFYVFVALVRRLFRKRGPSWKLKKISVVSMASAVENNLSQTMSTEASDRTSHSLSSSLIKKISHKNSEPKREDLSDVSKDLGGGRRSNIVLGKMNEPVAKHRHVGLYVFLLLNLILIGVGGWGLRETLAPKPAVAYTYPAQEQVLDSYNSKIEFEFNVPVDKELLVTNLSPQIAGEWEYELYADFLPWVRRIKFTPKQSFPPDQPVLMYLSYIANPIHPDVGNEYLLTFYPPAMPRVTRASIESEAMDVMPQTDIEFELDAPDGNHLAWDVIVKPETDFELIRSEQKLKVDFSNDLNQGTSYWVKVRQAPVSYDLESDEVIEQGEMKKIYYTSFKTVKAPLIDTFSPSGVGVLADEQIVVVFDEPMNRDSVEQRFVISPEVEGEFVWHSKNKKVTFIPNTLAKETHYEVKFKKGIVSSTGGKTELGVKYSFDTIGAARVSGNSPANGSSGLGLSQSVRVTFDQAVDHASAESHFAISPDIAGTFAWSGNSMYFYPSSSLGYSTTYTYSMGAGVASIYGVTSRTGVTASFTTMADKVLLDVPVYTQGRSGDDAYSCNIVAARMLLAYRGVYVSTAQLRSDAGYGGVRGSGNPHNGFVTSYGTYWGPVSSAAGKYRSTKLLSGGNLTALLTEVENGNPVMIWGQNGWSTPADISWTASDGTYIYAVSGMHSILVRGFEGTAENPTLLYVNDPWRGYYSMSVSQFRSNWSYFNMAMVVY